MTELADLLVGLIAAIIVAAILAGLFAFFVAVRMGGPSRIVAGQLMVLAGVVLTLAVVVPSLLAAISTGEPTDPQTLWRFAPCFVAVGLGVWAVGPTKILGRTQKARAE